MNRLSIIFIVILAIASVFLGIVCFSYQNRLTVAKNMLILCSAEKEAAEKRVNVKIITFNKLFIDKVLSAQGPVSYEDVFDLENAVSETGDAGLISQWNIFLASETEEDARRSVLAILKLCADKVLAKQ